MEFLITGVTKNNGIITDYGFHRLNATHDKFYPLRMKTKAEAIRLVQNQANSAFTGTWDYQSAQWVKGEKVRVIGIGSNAYLKSDPDDEITDNLGHLIRLISYINTDSQQW
ncbi:MAG: DUF3892 domain-containing protein [Flavobacterium sp.]|nr:DUF3892 domain-containing protein [Flavobacterium sp.]